MPFQTELWVTQIVRHFNLLLTYYAMIAPTELTQNYERLNTLYDPNQPIEMLFQRFQDARPLRYQAASPMAPP
jgi:hypothetical protein